MPNPTPIDDWRKQRFLEWLCTIKKDRVPSTQQELAEELGLNQHTLVTWKNDPEFLAAWEAKYRRTIGSPEKLHEVLNALFTAATDLTDPRMVPAAKEYRAAVEGVRPQQVDVNMTTNARELTDEQLHRFLTELAVREAQELRELTDG